MAETSGSQVEKLTQVLGFDPAKQPAPTKELLSEALGEITQERTKKAKDRAKELLTRLIGLREEFAKAQQAFRKAEDQFQKEVAKVLRSVEALTRGEAEPDPNPNEAQ